MPESNNSRTDNSSQLSKRNLMKFLIPSLVGVFLFIFPVYSQGNITIPIGVLVSLINNLCAAGLPLFTVIMVSVSAIGAIIYKVYKKTGKESSSSVITRAFDPTPVWLIGRIIGMVFAIMVFANFGPEIVISGATGGMVLYDLLATVIAILVFAGLLLPLLLEYGLVEFVGLIVAKVFRPLFTLPGRSAVDCLASWLGDASMGVVITDTQYQSGYYSAREAAIVMTNFNVVSITFCLVVIGQVGLPQAFIPYYLSVVLIGLVCAVIIPRIPPLSFKKDIYYMGQKKFVEEAIPEGTSMVKRALQQALEKAETGLSPKEFIKSGCANALNICMNAMPIVMALGTLAVILATYTPVFEWLGKPFVPLLELLNVPEATAASNTLMSGFVDMFIPAIVGASTIDSEITLFMVATISVSQIIFLSQAGALMLISKVPLNVVELFFVFLERTIIAVIMSSFLAKWLLPLFNII